jgi:hypothetical protein
MAAVVALAFSGLLVLAQVGMFVGIGKGFTAQIDRARADIMVLGPGAKALFGGPSGLPRRMIPLVYTHPEVLQVASAGRFGRPFPEHPVARGTGQGRRPRQAGRQRRRAAAAANLSRDTLRLLGQASEGERVGPLMVRVSDPEQAVTVRDQLNAVSDGKYRAWTRAELSDANQGAMLKEQIIGVMLGFSLFLGLLIGISITSQTLRAAILANIKEFASLRALGVSMGDLRMVVLELSFWVGIAGLAATAVLTFLVYLLAASTGLPLVFPPTGDLRRRLPGRHRHGLGDDGAGHPQEEPAGGPAAMKAYKPGTPALTAKGLVKRFKTGRTYHRGAQERRLRGPARRRDHGHGPVRLGQVDPGRLPVGPAAPRRRRGHRPRPAPVGPVARQDRPVPPRPLRLHLPGLQPVPGPDRHRAGLDGAQVRRARQGRGPQPGDRGLTEVGLGPRINQRPSELSGGEKQRVAIARALAKQPQLLFADEPTSALDGENGQIVIRLLQRAAKQHNAAVICVTHDPRLEAYADRIIHIEDGRILDDRASNARRRRRRRRTQPYRSLTVRMPRFLRRPVFW